MKIHEKSMCKNIVKKFIKLLLASRDFKHLIEGMKLNPYKKLNLKTL